MASTAVAVVPWPEIMTTGSVSSSACSLRSTSMPSMPGILMSSSTRSGRSRWTSGEPFLAGGGADELVVLVLEDHPQRVADRGLVVDDQDARFHTVVDR